MKRDEIKSDRTKNIDSIDMEISFITSTKPYSYSEQPSKKSSSYSEQPTTYIMKWQLLKSTEKYSYASQLTKNVAS